MVGGTESRSWFRFDLMLLKTYVVRPVIREFPDAMRPYDVRENIEEILGSSKALRELEESELEVRVDIEWKDLNRRQKVRVLAIMKKYLAEENEGSEIRKQAFFSLGKRLLAQKEELLTQKEELLSQKERLLERARELEGPRKLEEVRKFEELRKLTEILGRTTPQSLRVVQFCVKKVSASQLLQLLRVLNDVIISDFSDLSGSEIFQGLIHCSRQVLYKILLEKLFSCFDYVAEVILCLFEYLMGYIERGGWATYYDTSWEFRATYVSIELRLAAYFWIKFRVVPTETPSAEISSRKRARGEKGKAPVSYRDKRKKYEPRLKDLQSITKKSVWLYDYDTHEAAANAYWIGAFYYNQLKCFNDDVLEWCKANLPPMPLDLCPRTKELWVREQVQCYRPPSHSGGGIVVEQCRAAGEVAPMLSEGQEGDLPSIDDILGSSPPPCQDLDIVLQVTIDADLDQANASTGFLDRGQHDYNQEITVDDYNEDFAVGRSREGEVSRLETESEDLNLSRTYGDESAFHQQSIQPIHESGFLLECGGAVPEFEAEHHVVRASANQPQAPTNAQDLEFTDTIQSAIEELREQGWKFRLQPRGSTKFSVAFSGQGRPEQITASNYSAFHELHKQGWKITLEPISSASFQDVNGRLQSGSSSQELCSACNDRLFAA